MTKRKQKPLKQPKNAENVLEGLNIEQFRRDNDRYPIREVLKRHNIGTRRYYKIIKELDLTTTAKAVKKKRLETIITVQAQEQAKIIQDGYLNFIAGANLAVTETLENIQELKRLTKIFEKKIEEDNPELYEAGKMVTIMRSSLDNSINTLTKIMKFGKEIDETAQIIQAYQNVFKVILGVIQRYDPEIREIIMRELYDKYRMTLPQEISRGGNE